MDIAADAVFDLTAQAPRAPGEKAARAEAPDEPSFEDHLAPETDDKAEPKTASSAPPTSTQPPQNPLAAPPLLLQVIENAAPKSAPLSVAPANSEPPASTDLPAAATLPAPGPQTDAAPAPAPATAPTPPVVISPTPQATPQPIKGAQTKADAPKTASVETIEPDAVAAAPSSTAPTNPAAAPASESVAVLTPTAPPQNPRALIPGAPEPARGDVKASVGVGQSKLNAAPATAKSSAKIAAPVAATSEGTIAQRADSFDATLLAQSAHASTAQTSAQTQQATLERGGERPTPAAQVGREIVRRFLGENTRFELRLDPPELGRIEVRLDVSRDNRVTAIISADNPQALTDLVRHARELEQSLQGAGLELSENGLSFDLRQQSDTSRQAEREAGDGGGGRAIDSSTPEAVVTARPLGFERWRGVRVDVMA